MTRIGFLVDTDNCIGCRTCVIACKDANNHDLGCGFRQVRSFATGDYPDVAMYHVSYLPAEGAFAPKIGEVRNCNYCVDIREPGELPPCVASCPMRVLEWGNVDELEGAHTGKTIVEGFPALPDARADAAYIIKECMLDNDFDEVLM